MSTEVAGPRSSLSVDVAEEIRALMGRRQINKAEMARRLHVSEVWIGRRLNGKLPINLNELQSIAQVLGVQVADLLPPGARLNLGYDPLAERLIPRGKPVNRRPRGRPSRAPQQPASPERPRQRRPAPIASPTRREQVAA